MKVHHPGWLDDCDPDELDEAYEEATVDCCGDEVASSLTEMAMQELDFPFPATVMGRSVTVVDAVNSPNAAHMIDLVVDDQKQRYAIAACSVDLNDPLPSGHAYLAALLRWNATF